MEISKGNVICDMLYNKYTEQMNFKVKFDGKEAVDLSR